MVAADHCLTRSAVELQITGGNPTGYAVVGIPAVRPAQPVARAVRDVRIEDIACVPGPDDVPVVEAFAVADDGVLPEYEDVVAWPGLRGNREASYESTGRQRGSRQMYAHVSP